MRSRPSTSWAVLFLLLGLAGCDSSQDLATGQISDQELAAGASLVAVAGPSAWTAQQMMLAMVERAAPGVAPLTSGVPVSFPSQTDSFDLGNGISGTMEHAATGVHTFTFGGTIDSDGAMITVQGTLVLAPAADQPASGSTYLIDFDALASGPRGSATWSSTGEVTRDAQGQVVDYDVTMTHTVTSNAGASGVATVMLSPTRFELIVTGPHGNTLRFAFDRETMVGMLRVNGRDVAVVTVENGCAHVDYLDESRQDIDVCAAD